MGINKTYTFIQNAEHTNTKPLKHFNYIKIDLNGKNQHTPPIWDTHTHQNLDYYEKSKINP